MPPIALTIAILCLSHFLVDLMLGIWPLYKTLANLNLGVAGLIAGLGAFLGEGMQIFFGVFSDRGYRKIIIFFGLLLAFCGTLFVYTTTAWYLFFFYLGTCLGSGAFHPAAAGVMSLLTDRHKGLFIGVFVASGAIGMAFSQFLFRYFHTLLDGSLAWGFVLPVLLCLLAWRNPLPEEKKELIQKGRYEHLRSIFQLFSVPSFRYLYMTQVACNTVFWAVVFLLPDVLITREYPQWVSLGGGHLCFILGAAAFMIPCGHLADKFSARTVISFCSMMGIFLYYTFILNGTLTPPIVLTLLFFMGGFLGVLNSLVITLGNQMAPQQPGTISAFVMGLAWCVSECLGPGGGGFLSAFFEEDAPAKALAAVGVFLGVTFLMSRKLPKIIPIPNVTQELDLS